MSYEEQAVRLRAYEANHLGDEMGGVEERVERGVRMLDECMAGWWNGLEAQNLVNRPGGHLIDLATLDLNDPDTCVLGQLFNKASSPFSGFSFAALRHAVYFGFEACDLDDEDSWGEQEEEVEGEYEELTALWDGIIWKRRSMEWRAVTRSEP